ncbi:MAG: hypothetical protein K0S32_2630, partial [Bacteroidetes bacterium]|nr:hypothetical protein [Bacteroidota bacterium]
MSENIVGNIGLLALLAFSMLTFLVLVINLSFRLPQKVAIENDEIIEEELNTPEPVNVKENNTSFNETKELKLTPEEEAELLNFEIKQKGDDLVIVPVNKEEEKTASFEVIAPVEETLSEKKEEEIKPIEEIKAEDGKIELE